MDIPYLIQRATRRKHLRESAKGVDRYFAFDYMGSAEFEFDTLPKTIKAFRRIACKDWSVREVRFIPGNSITHAAYFVGREADIRVARAILVDQVSGTRALRFKDPTFLYGSYTGKDEFYQKGTPLICDGWWALTDAPFIFFKEREHADTWLKCLESK